jgi:hypothetical protein
MKQKAEEKAKKAPGLPFRTPYVRTGKSVIVNVAANHKLAIAKETNL